MVEIKNAISFDEYMTIVNTVSQNCFPNDTYSPAYYEIMFRYALIQMFAPEYDIPEISETNYNEVWDKVISDEANEILHTIRQNRLYPYLEEAVENAIDYRIRMITSSPMSMADMALANLLEAFANKVNEIDVNLFDKEDVNIVKQASESLVDGTAMETMVNTMLDKGYIAKPNRATRRNNIKHNKKSESK